MFQFFQLWHNNKVEWQIVDIHKVIKSQIRAFIHSLLISDCNESTSDDDITICLLHLSFDLNFDGWLDCLRFL